MNIHSYTVVHYGANYIGWALRSVSQAVEQSHIFYTSHPSHGHASNIPPIETSSRIFAEAKQFDYDNKIRWYQTKGISQEGHQRDYAVETCKEAGADIIIVVDCDEIWDAQVLEDALAIVQNGSKRNWLINFTHLWRSFNHCCHDEGWPVRFIDLRQEPDSNSIGYIPKDIGDIYHFGYAVTNKVMEYKWTIHGHKNELRPGWLDNQWLATPPVEDCHPTNERGFWNTEDFDKEELPVLMRRHPFYHLDRIE